MTPLLFLGRRACPPPRVGKTFVSAAALLLLGLSPSCDGALNSKRALRVENACWGHFQGRCWRGLGGGGVTREQRWMCITRAPFKGARAIEGMALSRSRSRGREHPVLRELEEELSAMADPVDVHVLEVWRDGKGDQGKGQRRESVLAREERGRRGGRAHLPPSSGGAFRTRSGGTQSLECSAPSRSA